MAVSPKTGALHHLTLTVTDVDRSIAFYKDHLGFEIVVKFEPVRALLSNGSILLALGPAYYPIPKRQRSSILPGWDTRCSIVLFFHATRGRESRNKGFMRSPLRSSALRPAERLISTTTQNT